MAEREWLLNINGRNVVIVAVINGLKSEIAIVREAVEKHSPDLIGISATEKQVEYLRKWNSSEEVDQPEYSDFDLLYAREMSKFGDVVLPSPAQLFAVDVADGVGIEIAALEMSDRDYAELYMKFVKPHSLFIDSIFRRRRLRKVFDGTAEEVVLKLDSAGRHPKGVELLDSERERHIAAEIARISEGHRLLLALVDYERSAGIRKAMENRQ